MEEFYDSAFLNLQKGKQYNRTHLIAYANYEYERLRFILVPLRGKITLGPRPQNKILVPFRGHFKKIRGVPLTHPRGTFLAILRLNVRSHKKGSYIKKSVYVVVELHGFIFIYFVLYSLSHITTHKHKGKLKLNQG